MVIKTILSRQSIELILMQYNLGRLVDFSPISRGSVQTNYIIYTTTGKYILRYYENRSVESVLFESDLLAYLKESNYPCAGMLLNQCGNYTSIYRDKPYVILEFIKGQHIEHPKQTHKLQLIKNVAELQVLTQGFRSAYQNFRWNYDPALCLELASVEAKKL